MTNSKADFDRALGERIRSARNRAGVKQDQLARAVGLSRTSVTNIEQGRQGLQVYLLARIAEVLGRTASDLLPDRTLESPSPLPEKVKTLDLDKRKWAERVLRSRIGDERNED